MDWNDHGGGYYNETEVTTPSGKSAGKSATRQQFLCPVTIRQVLEAPDEGLQIGSFTATMVTLCGIVTCVEKSATKITFELSDDTGTIDCLEWLDADDNLKTGDEISVVKNRYYQVYGCIKPLNGQRKIMIFKICPIESFNEYTAFLAEVMNVNQYAEKVNQMPAMPQVTNTNFSNYSNINTYNDSRTTFDPIQKAILDEIKANETSTGWSRKDSALNRKFSKKQIDDAIDFLVSEGHIYSTVDEFHYCPT